MQGPAQCHHVSSPVVEGCLIIAHDDGFILPDRISDQIQTFTFTGSKTHPGLEGHVVIVSPTLPELLVGLGALVLQAEH